MTNVVLDADKAPSRIAFDADALILALEADKPERASDPDAKICEAIYNLTDSKRVTIVIPAPAVSEWWIGAPGKPPPSGEYIEHVAFNVASANLMASYVGRAGLVALASTTTPKKYLKFDSMILGCLWSAKSDLPVSRNKDDFEKLLSLPTVPPERRLKVMTPAEFHKQYKKIEQIRLL